MITIVHRIQPFHQIAHTHSLTHDIHTLNPTFATIVVLFCCVARSVCLRIAAGLQRACLCPSYQLKMGFVVLRESCVILFIVYYKLQINASDQVIPM